MDLNAVAVFVKVVQAGSFSGAARLLGMPNTTVSAKVARLEKRLGVTLIHRTTRKLGLTPQGREYFERCVRGLEEIEAGESLLSSAAREPSGLMRITAPGSVAHHVLPPIVSAYLRTYSEVRIELVVTNRIVDLVGEGVDLAIRAGELRDSTLVARPFMEDVVGLWGSASYLARHGSPRAPEDLAHHAVLAFSRQRDTLQLSSGRRTAAIKAAWVVAADDLETLRAFVLRGDGLGLMPDYLARADRSLVRVLPEWAWSRGALMFVYPGRRYVRPTVRTFIDTALAHVQSP